MAPLQANRATGGFLADMSHEIRNPINGMVGMIELALDGQLSHEQREQLLAALQASDSLLALIDDIFDFSRSEAGRLELQARELSLRETLGRALRPLALRAREKNLELGYEVSPAVPERLIGDAGRLTQVVVNLVGNAIELAPRGSITLQVTAGEPDEPGPGGPLVRFAIRDTGAGIGAEDRQQLFEALTGTGDSPARSPRGGAALGLALSQRLVELMGGRLSVRSEPPAGSELDFTVRFQAAVAPEREEPLRGRRALVVEADPMAREMARDALTRAGASVTATSDPGVAARRLGAGPVDLIAADPRLLEAHPTLRAACLAAARAGAATAWLVPAGSVPLRPFGLGGLTVIRPFPPSALVGALQRGAGAREDAPPPGRERSSGRSLRILLAEDNPASRLLAEKRLLRWGHSVVSVEDGQAAVRAVERESFDLVLMDVQLPGIDGLEATARIRRHEAASGRRTPIVAMTAHALPGDRERLLGAGMDDYVPKPVRAAPLLAAIERMTAASAPAARGLSPSDEERLLSRLEGDRALLSEIAGLFVADAPRRFDELRSAIAAGDEPAARRANHTLRGAAGNFAVPEVNESLRRLGRMLRSGALRDRGSPDRLEQALAAAEKRVGGLVEQLTRVTSPASGMEATRGRRL